MKMQGKQLLISSAGSVLIIYVSRVVIANAIQQITLQRKPNLDIISYILQAFMVGSLWIITDNSFKMVELLK